MNISQRFLPALLGAMLLMTGCASPGYYGQQPVSQSYPQPYPQPYPQQYPSQVQTYPVDQGGYGQTWGTVESIHASSTPGGSGIGLGAVVGGVVGGLLGNQVGGGSGKKAATVAGMVGGAVVGNQMERNAQAGNSVQIGVRLDNGRYQTVVQDNAGDLRVGSRVRLENNRAYRY